jgi:hypothetical protein
MIVSRKTIKILKEVRQCEPADIQNEGMQSLFSEANLSGLQFWQIIVSSQVRSSIYATVLCM